MRSSKSASGVSEESINSCLVSVRSNIWHTRQFFEDQATTAAALDQAAELAGEKVEFIIITQIMESLKGMQKFGCTTL